MATPFIFVVIQVERETVMTSTYALFRILPTNDPKAFQAYTNFWYAQAQAQAGQGQYPCHLWLLLFNPNSTDCKAFQIG